MNGFYQAIKIKKAYHIKFNFQHFSLQRNHQINKADTEKRFYYSKITIYNFILFIKIKFFFIF